jgi:outer membrane protein assembly factor BamA
VRGYNERKVGPVDPVSKDPLGGEAMLIGNLEYTYPLLSFLKLAAFYDIGNVWEKMGDIFSTEDTFNNAGQLKNTGKLKSGMGFGVRIKTPIGPLVLDYGIPLDKEPGETSRGSGKFHFSTGYGF